MLLRYRKSLMFLTASTLGLALLPGAAAAAQPASGGSDQGTTLGEVVVTGTQIRGIAPAGAEVVGINAEQIQASGATTTAQLMASVPQVANQFGTLQKLGSTTVT